MPELAETVTRVVKSFAIVLGLAILALSAWDILSAALSGPAPL
jgi:hypothetical protein